MNYSAIYTTALAALLLWLMKGAHQKNLPNPKFPTLFIFLPMIWGTKPTIRKGKWKLIMDPGPAGFSHHAGYKVLNQIIKVSHLYDAL